MVVSRGVDGFSRGREHMAVVSRAVVTVVSLGPAGGIHFGNPKSKCLCPEQAPLPGESIFGVPNPVF